MPHRLTGARILVTRPEHQARGLVDAVEKLGGSTVSLPLLDIVPAAAPETLRAALRAAQAADWWLFTSRNAADTAGRLLAPPWRPRAAAVGDATAAALHAAGVDDVLVPQGRYSAAALLALPELETIRGQSVAILTGADGSGEAAAELQSRGARVQTLELYRRVPRRHAPDAVAAALRAVDAVVITSGSGLEQLIALTPEPLRAELMRLQLVVPAPRVVELARSQGFVAPPLLPDQISDAACARTLARWWSQRAAGPA